MGDELGGHLLSGHIIGMGKISDRVEGDDNLDLMIECPQKIMKYVQEKGYIAIDGISLTIGKVTNDRLLSMIPETISLTTIGTKNIGESVNIEVDSMTQTIVTTVERILEARVMTNIAIVCGSYHKTEIERMLNLARDQAEKENLKIVEVIWVPGAMEVPLALSRVMNNPEIHGAACAWNY